MQQRLTNQPGPTHAYETRWSRVATANPFWPLIVKPNMRVPSLDLSRAYKDTFGILVEMGPHKLLLKLVILSSASHLTPFYNHAPLHVKVWLSHPIILQLPLKAHTRFPHATQGTYLIPTCHPRHLLNPLIMFIYMFHFG